MSEYDKLMRTARYSPTTVGNMVLDKNGAYCSIDAIEQLERQLAERDAEIAKYRDAPVVASASVSNRTGIYGPTINFDYGEALRMAVPPSGKPIALIVKPGEQ